MNPINAAFAFIAGYLVIGAGAFVICSAINYLRNHSEARLAVRQLATGLVVILGGLALTVAGLFGVAFMTFR